MRERKKRRATFAAVLLLFAFHMGCRGPTMPNARGRVSQDLAGRFGSGISQPKRRDEFLIPPGVVLEDGMTEDEATQIALWNNAGFQELLADLGVSRSQLFDAGLIADPQLVIFFPLSPKQLEFTIFETVNSIWLRNLRVRIAEMDLKQVSQAMVQNGLNTVRDARVAHANLVQSQQQAEVANDAAAIRTQIAELARKRLAGGDISELELTTAEIDALQAKATAARAVQDVQLSQHRLRTILGLTMLDAPLVAIDESTIEQSYPDDDPDRLISSALAMRPDLRAAEIAYQAACERVGLAKRGFMILDAIYDANGSGKEGFESGPGLRFTVPIFNRNRGVVAIADAQWQRVSRQYVTVRDQITLDVRTAHTQLKQARENLELIQGQILPALQEAQRLAQRNYEDGGTDYFLVLQTTGPYLDARNRESLLLGDVRRAVAELDRSVGTRLTTKECPASAVDVPDLGNLQQSAMRPVP